MNAGELILKVVEKLKKKGYKVVGPSGYGKDGCDFMMMRDPSNEEEVPIKLFSERPNKDKILWLDDTKAVVILSNELILTDHEENEWKRVTIEELVEEVEKIKWLGSYP